MLWHPTKDAMRRLWSRRWVRRLSYSVVAGATALTLGPWVATRPVVLHWAVGRLGLLVREETGLALDVGSVELHPALGSMVLHDIRLGGDLLWIRKAELQLDLWSFLGPVRRIHALRIEHPHLRLTEAGLAAIRLKDRRPRTEPLPRFRLDLFSLTGGEIELPEPVRGLPALRYQYEVKATGVAPNHVRFDLVGPVLSVRGPGGWQKGRLDLNGEASESVLVAHAAYLRLGESQVRLSGRYQPEDQKSPGRIEARLTGVLDLAQAAWWSSIAHPPLVGDLDIAATIQGPLLRPTWTFSAQGQDLQPAGEVFLAGSLEVKASGGPDQARLDLLNWRSAQGELLAEGTWLPGRPVQGSLQGTNLDLEALSRVLRLPELRDGRGAVQARFQAPGAAASMKHWETWKGELEATLSFPGQPAGRIVASLDQGRLAVERLDLDLQDLKVAGSASVTLAARGPVRAEAEARLEVGVGQVARALNAWRVVALDMDGDLKGQARARWEPSSGLALEGALEVLRPRWHGAQAEHIRGKVAIQGSDLWVKDIEVRKGEGQGGGDLWLTWADRPPGQDQLDMCYTAFRLPVAEGLKAADLGHLPLSGTASGWTRLHGTYAHMVLDGFAQVESGEAYSIKVPAVSTAFNLDLSSLLLNLEDLRVAEQPDLLGRGEVPPEGVLALSGRARLDLQRWQWWVDLGGRIDSHLLALPGPRIQSQLKARLLGPITSPFGVLDLPQGQLELSRGRVFFGARSMEGLEGLLRLERGHLQGHVALEGMARPMVEFQVQQAGSDLTGNLALSLSRENARTEALARSLTEDLLEDLTLDATLTGRWKNGQDLVWNGSLEQLAARFSAFELHQPRPSMLHGDAVAAQVDIALEGGAREQSAGSAANVQVSGTVPFLESSPVGIRLTGAANLTHLKTILDRVMEVDEYSLLSELQVQGTSRFDLLAHGTYAEPLLDGSLSLEQGQMHLRGYQGVEDLYARVVLKDRTMAIPEADPLRGTLAHGDLRASGVAVWQPGGLDSYAMKASLTGFQLRDVPDGLDLQGTLEATLEGGEDGGLLKGKLRADRLGYQTEVKLSDLILRSAISDTGGLTGLDLNDPLNRIRLDLDLELRSPWNFDTNLLKLEGRPEGPFQVLGTLAHPVPRGTMLFQPGGRLTNIFPAGDMVVDRGSLSFSEARPMDPVINLQGSVSSIPGYTVNLDIRGTLSNLAIVPSSIPSLRQDEIVAILINPGNVANVGTAGASTGATQGAITSGLASAGSGLISTLAFAPFQEQLRKTLGLDRVNVAVRTTTLGTTETEVTLGKSLNLLGQRSAFVVSHRKSGEVSITSGQVEWRFGGLILQLGASRGGGVGLNPSGEIRHSWSPK